MVNKSKTSTILVIHYLSKLEAKVEGETMFKHSNSVDYMLLCFHLLI